jgi:hypothetical protein
VSQKTARKRQVKETAAAEEFIDEQVEKVRQRKPKEYDFTSDDIIRVRDHNAQSWRAVAQHFGLKSPGAARAAYTALTGVRHDQSQPLVKRQAKGTYSGKPSFKPGWDDDADQDEIIQRVQGEWHPATGQGKDYRPGYYDGSTLTIRRNHFNVECEETWQVARIVGFKYDYNDKLEMEIVDRENNSRRTCYVTDIAKVD